MNGDARRGLQIGLLTGGIDKPYAFGLSTALSAKGVRLDFIGSDEIDNPALHTDPNIHVLNLRGSQDPNVPLGVKMRRIGLYYARLLRYALSTRSKVFHILWNNKFQVFDRTLLMLYYRLLGKRIAFTAHNVNAAKRDNTDSFFNRLTLRIQYRLCDRIFVHTAKMRDELIHDFGVPESSAIVIPFGINNAVPHTALTTAEAKRRLGLGREPAMLFFGRIGPYKGLEFLAEAFEQLAREGRDYRLLVIGSPKEGSEQYVSEILSRLEAGPARGKTIAKIEFVPDSDTELYFKAADVLLLPYTDVFQSGVLFLSYSFGLPVIATRVGSFEDDIQIGRNGLMCAPRDAADLARTIDSYFAGDMYRCLEPRRAEIRREADAAHSWDTVGDMTVTAYTDMLGGTS